MTQQLESFQSSWSMELHRLDGFEWTLEEKFRKVAAVSYHRLSIDIVSGDNPTVEQAQSLFGEFGLAACGYQRQIFSVQVVGCKRLIQWRY